MTARLTYKTSKGTELPLLNLRGKEYLEVKHRIVWLREEHPQWSIETELVNVAENSALARAVIKDESGRILATSHKFEDRKGFPDFIEKAETGAIGRACALLGYGTQFCADELDEGERIVDAPGQAVQRPQAAQFLAQDLESPWDYTLPTAWKNNGGASLGDLGADGVVRIVGWLKSLKTLNAQNQEILEMCKLALKTPRGRGA